ncbi:MAG: C_GCAxxG_C_C family protein [Alistipes sp.]|nr:C_GCAxxG_C_C family protein [Alistipes sp.]
METIKINAEERAERAKGYFNKGYNCAQSVALAFADITSLDEEMVAKITASFGGGMGRLREVCGAVSGMAFLASFISPCPGADNAEAKKANYALVQEFAEQFRQQNGNIVCRSLLGLDCPKDEPTPSPRTAEYYKKRPCSEYVYDAALIVGNYLANRG